MMRYVISLSIVSLAVLSFSLWIEAADPSVESLSGRLVAVGIPGAGAVSAVGAFHPGGPIQDKAALRALTEPDAVLDPRRILVASTSNFGAPPATTDYPAGAILSIDPRVRTTLVVPPTFGAAGGQARALDGCVMLYTAQSAHFLNKVYNARADESMDETSPGEVYIDGVRKPFEAGQVFEIPHGRSMTIVPRLYHRFWAKEGGGVLVGGEISTISVPKTDNHFGAGARERGKIDE